MMRCSPSLGWVAFIVPITLSKSPSDIFEIVVLNEIPSSVSRLYKVDQLMPNNVAMRVQENRRFLNNSISSTGTSNLGLPQVLLV